MSYPVTLSKAQIRAALGVRGGLGALNKQTGRDAIGAGVSLAPVIAGAMSSTATVASATGLAPMLTAIGVSGPAAPFVAAAIAVALPVFKLIKSLASGCGETCIATSNWANQAANGLNDVKAKYFAQPVRTVSSQVYAVQIIDTIFAQLRELCSNPATGDAGRRCIQERLVPGVEAPWCANSPDAAKIRTANGCNWIALYRDPIVNDPGVVPDPDPVEDSLTSLFGGSGSGSGSGVNWPLVLLAAAGLYAVVGD